MKQIRNKYGFASATLALAFTLSACSSDDATSDGAAGSAGVDGQNGKDGKEGPEGPEGPKGDSGTQGQPGTPGAEGEPGQDGVDGEPGVDGNPATGKTLSFVDVGFAKSNAEKHQARASKSAVVNGEAVALDYQVILRSNQDPAATGKACALAASPETCFGALLNAAGDSLLDDDGESIVASSHDYTSILEVGSKIFMVNAFESNPSGMFVSEIEKSSAGVLSAKSTKAIDLSPIDGMWFSCAGMVSPWNTHLASEEFPPDARTVQTATTWAELKTATGGSFGDYVLAARYWGVDVTDANTDGTPDGPYSAFLAKFTPHFHGYAVEVALSSAGVPTLTKHYAMGRYSLEVPYVMPDRKTVILTDDGANVGLFMFIADSAGDLSAGNLYAMRAFQTSPVGGPALTADIDWISLGHATDAQVKALLHPASGARITFADIFDAEMPAGDGSCPTAGFAAVRGANSAALECLKVKSGMELAASRLETRRYAALLGATTEFNKEEGITFDPDNNRMYVALSAITGGMGAQTGGADHINVASNSCGGVWALDVGPWTNAAAETVTTWAPLNWYPVVIGVPTTYPVGSSYAGNTCSIGGIASPDNVAYLPGYNTLIIGEDTAAHQNDAIWSYDLLTRKLTRIMTTPYGSETTSPYWTPNLKGNGYLTAVIQHPYGESDQARVNDAESTGPESWVGVIGPFPALD